MTPDPVTHGADNTLADAALAMRERDLGDAIIEQDGAACGIITDRDM